MFKRYSECSPKSEFKPIREEIERLFCNLSKLNETQYLKKSLIQQPVRLVNNEAQSDQSHIKCGQTTGRVTQCHLKLQHYSLSYSMVNVLDHNFHVSCELIVH